jgi:hypothetical protein
VLSAGCGLHADKQLDLKVPGYNFPNRKLFLSAGAPRGRLVHAVPQFRTVGC